MNGRVQTECIVHKASYKVLLAPTVYLLLDVLVSGLRVLAAVHFVQQNDHLRQTQSKGQERVFLSLALSTPTTCSSYTLNKMQDA